MRRLLMMLTVVLILIPLSCFGESSSEDLKKTIENIAVPESPAFAVLGVSPEKVVIPANGKELALGLLQGLDEKGNMQNGLAIDFSPYLMIAGPSLTLNQYRSSYVKQLLSHTQISMGTSKGSSTNDKSTKLATGLKVTIFDLGDPRNDLELGRCISKAQNDVLAKYPIPLNISADKLIDIKEKMKIETEEMAEVCRQASAKNNLNKPALDIGMSPIFTSLDGETKNLDWGGVAVWSSFKYGIGDMLLILNAKYRNKDQRQDSTNTAVVLEGDAVSVGGKLRYGATNSGLLLQGVYSQYAPKGQKNLNEFLYSAGGEIKVATNLWLQASVGSTAGNAQSKPLFVTGQFKWAISETSALK